MIDYCGEINIRRIFLMLGPACNFKCRYCLQSNMNDCSIIQEPTEEVYNYIEHLIRLQPSFMKHKLSILFWGGEPLLYINIIKKVVSRLGDKVEYALVTNGSLITKELVDYFNDNNISITLSNDGVNTVCTRNVNVLDNLKQRKLISKINRLSIESVTSMYNYDYKMLFDYIDDCFKGRDINVGIDTLKVTWDMPADIYNIPLDDYNEKLRILANEALNDMINMKDTKATRLFQKHVEFIIKKEKISLPKCGAFYVTLDIDCSGNVYVCHNSGETIGRIDEDRDILAVRYDKWLNDHSDQNCINCPVYDLCGCACPLQHNYRQKVCNIYKVFYSVCVDLANAYMNSFEKLDWSVANND